MPKAAIGALGAALVGGVGAGHRADGAVEQGDQAGAARPDRAGHGAERRRAQKSVDSTDAAVNEMDKKPRPPATPAGRRRHGRAAAATAAAAAPAVPAPVQAVTPDAPPVVNAPVARVPSTPAPTPRPRAAAAGRRTRAGRDAGRAAAPAVTPPADVQPPAMQQTPDTPTVTPSAPAPAPTPDTPDTPAPAPAPTAVRSAHANARIGPPGRCAFERAIMTLHFHWLHAPRWLAHAHVSRAMTLVLGVIGVSLLFSALRVVDAAVSGALVERRAAAVAPRRPPARRRARPADRRRDPPAAGAAGGHRRRGSARRDGGGDQPLIAVRRVDAPRTETAPRRGFFHLPAWGLRRLNLDPD